MSTHGTDARYRHQSCRCSPCRHAHAATNADKRERARLAIVGGEPWHGSYQAYVNRMCRCVECTAAWAAYKAGWRARKRAHSP